ncbi:MAG: hypothetical protein M1839_001001 [Geoglossum umbratile]|nr:MAG: hypothetical protein M1839_001001 [Geoglossum umbratile]
MAAAYGLLLLPPPPSPPSPPALKAALDPPLTSALARLAKIAITSSKGAILDLAIPCPGFDPNEQDGETPAQLFGRVQRLLAGIYSLLAFIYDRDSIGSSGEGVVDARILLIYYNPVEGLARDGRDIPLSLELPPCVVELSTLTRSRRRWTHVFVVESEPGEDIYQQFKLFAAGGISERSWPGWKAERVRGGLQIRVAEKAELGVQITERRAAHYDIVIGGAYDHLHFGHKLVLTMTAFLAKPLSNSGNMREPSRIVIGITEEDPPNNEKYSQYMESWEVRQKNVVDFLLAILEFTPPGISPPEVSQKSELGPGGKAVITKLHSYLSIEGVAAPYPYDPAMSNEKIWALVISGRSRGDAKEVNDRRAERGWHRLDVFEVYVVDAESLDTDEDIEKAKSTSFKTKLSSTETRKKMHETLQGSYLPAKDLPINIQEVNDNGISGDLSSHILGSRGHTAGVE